MKRAKEPPIIPTIDDGPARDRDPELERLARWMDTVFEVPGLGVRFGLDSILGLIPGLGDTATSLISFYILTAAVRRQVPKITVMRMALNVGIDYVFGSVPLLGDLFDVWWKSNTRNLELIQKHAVLSPLEARRASAGDWLFVAGVILLLIFALVLSITASIYLLSWLVQQLADVPLRDTFFHDTYFEVSRA